MAAADLRQKLKQVVELQRSHTAGSSKQAEAVLAELRAEPSKAPSIHTAYKQSEHLRDIARSASAATRRPGSSSSSF